MQNINLAREVRPQRFDQVIGQKLTVEILKNSIRKQSIASAYLLCGARGTGKTSLARILAKAINCQQQNDGEPCNQCSICKKITNNGCLDVLEIDAASNRGIDNIRELKQAVNFEPLECAFKVYIIDEVHMLTNESFNALLKTLEEPPHKVKFILATTNPQKLPDTILSRCLRLDLGLIEQQDMLQALQNVCQKLNLTLAQPILELICQKSGGGLRDALNMIDMLATFDIDNLQLQDAQKLMGWISINEILTLWKYIFAADTGQALDMLDSLLRRGTASNIIIAGLLENLSNIAVAKEIAKNHKYWSLKTKDLVNQYYEISTMVSLSKLFLAFDLLVDLRIKSASGLSDILLLEMAVIKLAHLPDMTTIDNLIDNLQSSPSAVTTVKPQPLATKNNNLTANFKSPPNTPSPSNPQELAPNKDGLEDDINIAEFKKKDYAKKIQEALPNASLISVTKITDKSKNKM